MARNLKGASVLITAGPTYEFLDDVRFLGNPATGRMGIELAQAAIEQGGNPTIVMGPTHLPAPAGAALIPVVSAQEMMEATAERFDDCDVFIASAAVSDYRPAKRQTGKIKKRTASVSLELVRNPDILHTVTKRRRADQVIVGFSLESSNLVQNARSKLEKKRCDLMVVNTPGHFGDSATTVWILNREGVVAEIPPSGKRAVAVKVLELVERLKRGKALPVIESFKEPS